jgi:serine/threonine protein kinase
LHEKLLIHRLSISAGTRLQLGTHLASALIFLESYHIAHLDLTPANIIIDRDLAKLVDFGEAYSPDTAKGYRIKRK